MFEDDGYGGGIDYKYWLKFVFCFIAFVILPVWVFNFADSLSLLWKIGFTFAGAGGIFLDLLGKSVRLHK